MASRPRRLQTAWGASDGAVEGVIPLARFGEKRLASAGDLVVAARGALLALSDVRAFPCRPQQPFTVEPPEDRIHRAARQSGGVHDVEPVMEAASERLQHERC